MNRTLPIMEARRQLTSLPETLTHDGEVDIIEVTRRGKPVLAIIPWELYEAISETLEIMGDRDLMAKFRQSIKEMQEGKSIPWEKAKLELGI